MPSPWRHALCFSCYVALQPGREPFTLRIPLPALPCCRCGFLTEKPIYYRDLPEAFPCQGEHAGQNQ